jgi:hypothetical protein
MLSIETIKVEGATVLHASLNPRHVVLLLRSKLRLKITLVGKGQL